MNLRKNLILFTLITGFLAAQSINEIEDMKKQLEGGAVDPTAIITAQEQLESTKVESDIESELPELQKVDIQEVMAPPQVIEEITKVKIDKEEETKKEIQELSTLEYFGYDFFTKTNKLMIWDNLPVQMDYLLGPGDEVIVTLWGDTELRVTSVVNRDGNVYFNRIGLINLIGRDFKKTKALLRKQFEKVYSTLKGGVKATTYMEVSLGTLKSINVRFLGEIINPGMYPIHPFSTVLTGITQAGGVLETGSLRNIQVIRGGEIISYIDLYSFFLNGDVAGDIQLQDNDIILVPLRESTVTIRGQVRRPEIFEIKKGETLDNLIRYAGGLTPDVGSVAEVRRIVPIQERESDDSAIKIISVNLVNSSEFKISDGDDFVTRSIHEVKRFVTVVGQVKKPGRYQLYTGMKIRDLLANAGGIFDPEYWKTVYPFRADLVRNYEDETRSEIIPIKLNNLKDGDEERNIELLHGDKLFIYSINVNRYKKIVSIFGEVRNPGEYPLDSNMGIRDLILRAGGFKYSAYPVEVEIVSVDPFNVKSDKLSSVVKFKMSPDIFDQYSDLGEFKLHDHDQVIVRRYPDFQYQRNIVIKGEIKFPGVYSIEKKGESLEELIERTGGLGDEAFIEGLKMFRNRSRVILRRSMWNKMDLSIPVAPGDSILVPRYPNVVEVIGQIHSPGLIQYRKGMSLKDYIKTAGGYTDKANRWQVSVYHANGEVKSRWFLIDPKVREGSKIVVYQEQETLPFDVTAFLTEATAIVMQSLSIYFIVTKLAP